MPALSSECTRKGIPRAVLRPQPLQHLRVPEPRGLCATVRLLVLEIFIPRATMLPRSPQHLQVPAPGESLARGVKLPRAAVRHGPDERRKGLAKRRDADPRPLRAAADARRAR